MSRTYARRSKQSGIWILSIALSVSACMPKNGGGYKFGLPGLTSGQQLSGSGSSGGQSGGGSSNSGSSGTISNGGSSEGDDSAVAPAYSWPGSMSIEITAPASIAKVTSLATHYGQRGAVITSGGYTMDSTCQVNITAMASGYSEDDVLHPPCVVPSPSPGPTAAPCMEGSVSMVYLGYMEKVSSPSCSVAITAKTYTIADEKDKLPFSSIMATVCRSGSYVTYSLPNAVFNGTGMDYSSRTGTATVAKIAHDLNDPSSIVLDGVKLANPMNASDTITAKITISEVQLYGATSCR